MSSHAMPRGGKPSHHHAAAPAPPPASACRHGLTPTPYSVVHVNAQSTRAQLRMTELEVQEALVSVRVHT